MAVQWPAQSMELAELWTQIAHGTRIFELCESGLKPVIKKGLVIMYSNEQPTELTCALKFKPPKGIIEAAHLVTISVLSLFLTMNPKSALSFCKGKWSFNNTPFFNHIQVMLSPAIEMPPSIAEACKIENPNVRSFVFRAWVKKLV